MSRKKRKKERAPRRPLARQVFPELNATFYTAEPAEFIKMRIEALSLLGSSDDDIRKMYSKVRNVGNIEMRDGTAPTEDERQRYISAEASMVAQHAAETLLRMYFAHLENVDCPWLGMASSCSFADFKKKISRELKGGFPAPSVAAVFLGGENPESAGVDLPLEEFEEFVESMQFILRECSQLFLEDSFRYNAAKHGLTTVQLDETGLSWQAGEAEKIPLHFGKMTAFLHKPLVPAAPKGSPEWHLTGEADNPERDLFISSMIQLAVGNLWAVARRKYVARPGVLHMPTPSVVENAFYGTVWVAGNLMRKLICELPKIEESGDISNANLNMVMWKMPKDWQPEQGVASPPRVIELPLRKEDAKNFHDSGRYLLPFSPRGSSSP